MVVSTATSAGDKPRSMNRSCIQCRERKIKCDRLDPCTQCTSKGATEQCKRELRKKRAKNKRPFPKRKSRSAAAATATEPAHPVALASQPPRSVDVGLEAAASMLSWAERPITSASHHSESAYTPSSASAKVTTPNTSSSAYDSAYFGAHAKHGQHLHNRPSASSTQPRSQGQARSSSFDESSSGPGDDDDDAEDDDDDDDEALQPDDNLHMVEANRLMAFNIAPPTRCPFALKDVYAEWRSMSIEQRRSLLGEIRAALPTAEHTLRLLHDVYAKCVHSLHGNITHIPTVHIVLTELLTDPNYELRDQCAFGQITTALMVIHSALRAAPLDRNYTCTQPGSRSTQLQPLSQKDMRQRQKNIYLLVKRIQRFESAFTFGSIPELQTAILMLACGKGSPAFLDSLTDCAIRSAMRMRIHRLGSFDKLHSPRARPVQCVTAEMAVRCWWALVRHDWSQSNKHRSYRIAPSQFNTRLPLNLFDEELLIVPLPRSHLRSTWTHVSYSFATIEFASMTRSLVDQVNSLSDHDDGPDSADGWGLASVYGQRLSAPQRDSLDQTFQSLISAFPAHYSLDARYDSIAIVDVERWLLHQRLFHLLLTLHMPLFSEATRCHGSLMYMANHILEIQDKVTDIGTLLDHDRVNTLQTLRACLVLLLDLFFAEAPANISGLSRLMTRRKIVAALEKTPMDMLSSTTKLCVQLVRVLLLVEEQQHRSQLASLAPSGMSQEAGIEPMVDAATLRSRWHATCQILDVLLNDGYWRSFRKNLVSLDHLIPEWLQRPLREDTELLAANPSATQSDLVPPMSTASAEALPSLADAEPGFVSRIERAFDAGNTESMLGAIDEVGLAMPFDPKLMHELDSTQISAPDSSSQLAQLDLDLLGQLDFEGYGNSSQSLDFAKMLMDWRVEIPIPS